MSGSGGGGSHDDSQPLPTCESIGFVTNVNSPQADALVDLQEGDILEVRLEDNSVVVRRLNTLQLVGSINWSFIVRLIDCMKQGFEYMATVRRVDDGLVQVHVYAK